MANIHILTLDGAEVSTLMHFAVPATNNTAGTPWQTIAARIFGKTVLPDGDGTQGTISAAEKASIVSGALVEQANIIKLGTSSPNGAQLDAAFAAAQSAFQATFQATYQRYGQTR